MARQSDILPTLEFNAQDCGDAIARAYFAMAAREIRTLRSRVMALEADRQANRLDIAGLEGSIARLIVQTLAQPDPTPAARLTQETTP